MPTYTFDSINYFAERQHFLQQDSVVAAIDRYYDEIIPKIAVIIASGATKAVIDKKVDKLLTEVVRKTVFKIETGMQKSWTIANDRTKDYVEQKYKGVKLPDNIQKALDDKRTKALNQFTKRRENGLDLSKRIWKTADQYKEIIEKTFDEEFPKAIQEGRSSRKIAKDLRKALQDPQIKPGQGVYKSPTKNAMRVARTEINMAYRMSDQKAWQANPLVLGYRINLSATGKPKVRCEICRTLAGDYPTDFVWRGWHPNCLCFKTPILMSEDMLAKYTRLIAQGKDTPEAIMELQKDVRVTKMPKQFDQWVEANAERVAKWKSKPYWMK